MTHHEKCTQMFDHVINGKSIYIRIDEDVYKKQYNEYIPLYSDDTWITMSILSDEMIDYDQPLIFEPEKLPPDYYPYFISFQVQAHSIYQHFNRLSCDQWYCACFLSDSSDSNRIDSHDQIVLDGQLLTSASPVFIRSGKVLIYGGVSSTIYKRLKQTKEVIRQKLNHEVIDKAEANTVFQDFWRNESIQYIDCYNVGKGNVDHIQCETRSILYDFGLDFDASSSTTARIPKPRFPATDNIKTLTPNGVILSHWDMDHILGCTYCNPKILTIPWIAPNYINSASAYRLARYIQLRGTLYLVNTYPDPEHLATFNASEYSVHLYQGAGEEKPITPINCHGLLLELNIKKNNDTVDILLAGDVPYSCMPNRITHRRTPYHCIHVPHHCREMELTNLKGIVNSASGSDAIISEYRGKVKPKLSSSEKQHYAELVKLNCRTFFTTHRTDHLAKRRQASTVAVRIDFTNPGDYTCEYQKKNK